MRAIVKALVFILILSPLSFAQERKDCGNDLQYKVFFVNGVWNEQVDAQESLKELKEFIQDKIEIYYPTPISKWEFDLAYNQTQGSWLDIIEVNSFVEKKMYQKIYGHHPDTVMIDMLMALDLYFGGSSLHSAQHIISIPDPNVRQPKNFDSYHELLGEIIDSPDFDKIRSKYVRRLKLAEVDTIDHIQSYKNAYETGHKVILVSHSEGNFFANNALRQIEQHLDSHYIDSMGVFGVANPDNTVFISPSTPDLLPGSMHTTFYKDRVINGLRGVTEESKEPILANTRTCLGDNSGTLYGLWQKNIADNHRFVEHYLECYISSDKIWNGILNLANRLKDPKNTKDCEEDGGDSGPSCTFEGGNNIYWDGERWGPCIIY